MRPSYEAMLEIEERLGPILSLSLRLQSPSEMLSVADIAVIVSTCIKAAGKDRDDAILKGVNANKVRRLIFEEGVHNCVAPLSALMLNMLTGGAKAKKKPEGDQT